MTIDNAICLALECLEEDPKYGTTPTQCIHRKVLFGASCDLTPLDFFLWGFLRLQVNTNKPQSTDVPKVNITQTIAQLQPDLCDRVIENWTTVRSCGGYLADVIFHT
ncbi:hypothetical protein Trydic_g6540 [Trypoxylus dichotomus]